MENCAFHSNNEAFFFFTYPQWIGSDNANSHMKVMKLLGKIFLPLHLHLYFLRGRQAFLYF